MDLRDRASLLPLPLAQLVQRAFHATSAVERHNCAYYLAEATLKLAAAVRVRLYLEHALEPHSRVARRLVCLKLPSVGQWCDLLRATNDELGRMQDAPSIPLARVAARLNDKRPDWIRVSALVSACLDAGLISADLSKRALSSGLTGVFELIPAYRNNVMAHGAQRSDAWYDHFGVLLLGALEDLLCADALFDRMVLARPVCDDSATPNKVVWQHLMGTAALNSSDAALGVDPAQLYFVSGAAAISVHPLIVSRQDALGRHQVGFLNRTVVRTRTIADGLLEEVRRVDYLDYATGDAFSGDEARQDVGELIARPPRESLEDLGIAAPLGAVIVGDFELEAELGRGATGVVYRARQKSLLRTVALKLLHPTLSSDASQLKRFRREISALAKCDHPNVVKILTAGADADRNWYAMEFLDGVNLARLFALLSTWRQDGVDLRESHLEEAVVQSLAQRAGALSAAHASGTGKGAGRSLQVRLAELFADVADGVAHLHDAGIVHRDIKPGNLVITRDCRRIVLMDLGSAHVADASRLSTASGSKVFGTLRYVAPEQLVEQTTGVDARADVYALGVTLYELATGRRFFDGDNDSRLVHQVLQEAPLPPSLAAPFLSKTFATVLQTATAKDLGRRYASARSLRDDLRSVARGEPIRAREPAALERAADWARRHRFALPVTVAAGALAAAATSQLWSYARVDVTHFEACADARDGRVGVGEVSSSDGRYETCVVYRRGGRILQAQTVNGSGYPSAAPGQTASFEFLFSDSGELIERIERRRDGRVRQKHRFAWQGDSALATIVDFHNMRTSLDGSDVAMYRLEFDRAGFPARQMFFSDRGSPRANAQLVYGYAFEVDGRGLVTKRTALSSSGAPSIDARGVAFEKRSYDERGRLTSVATYDAAGSPVTDDFGVALVRTQWDRLGNPVESRFYDAMGHPAVGEDGSSGWQTHYDRHGNPYERAFLGIDGAAARQANGVAIVRAQFDERGRRIAESSHDATGGPAVDSTTGCGSWRAAYDDRGNRTEQSFYHADGTPCRHVDGYSVWRASYDERSNLLESSYFDERRAPTLHKDGVASFRITYDARGNVTEVRWFGPSGAPAPNRSGYAIRRLRYDERGNVVEISYFDASGQPIEDSDGVAIVRASYDELGDRIEQTWFDRSARAARNRREGVAGIRYGYDDRGRVVGRLFLDELGHGVAAAAGYAEEVSVYGVTGDVTQVLRLDTAGHVLSMVAVDVRAARVAARDAERSGVRGVAISGVDPSGAAGRAGLRIGDVVTRVGGTPVQTPADLAAFDRTERSTTVGATVFRAGSAIDVQLVSGALGLAYLER